MLAALNWTTPAAVIVSMTFSVTPDGGGTDDGVDVLAEQAVDRLVGGVGLVVAGVAGRVLDRRAEHAAGLVDVGDGQLDAGELGWSEERQVAGLRQQRADLQDAVALALDADRDEVDDRRVGRLGLRRSSSASRRCGCRRRSAARRSVPDSGSPLPFRSFGPETPS